MNVYGSFNTRADGPYAAAMPTLPRGDLAPSPEEQSRMHGIPPNPAYGPPSIGQRRRPSETGSQQSSRAESVANSRSSDGTISDQQSRRYKRMEAELLQHYTILRSYLKGGAQQPPRANKARDKLLRLSGVQFHELSTDVFDELQRRQAAAPLPGREPRQKSVPPFLQPVPQFHEKRNQARQKLSSLQTSRFRDLSTDVFCELERRFPHFPNPELRRRDSSRSVASRGGSGRPPLPPIQSSNGSAPGPNGFPPRSGSMPGGSQPLDNHSGSTTSTGSEFGRPMPKQYQSSTATPNKSTMVEDDDDEDDATSSNYGGSRSSDAFGLESAAASPVSERGRRGPSNSSSNRDMRVLQEKVSSMEMAARQKDERLATLQRELQRKVDDAENLNQNLQEQIERLKAEHAFAQQDLRQKMLSSQKAEADRALQDSNDQLQRDNQNLRLKLDEQQKITDEVSQRGEMFLNEMRAMAEHGSTFEREEKLQLHVHKLEEEVKEWKARYAKARSQARIIPGSASEVGLSVPNVGQVSKDSAFHSPNGLVKDVHVSQFQISIDELLQSARSQDPNAVLVNIRDLVAAVREITLDVDNANHGSAEDERSQRITKLRARLSATANNVITAARSHAAAGGLSPVSLLDAAASHLTAAVVDLLRLVQVCTKLSLDDSDEDGFVQIKNMPEPVNDAGYFNMAHRLRKPSAADSEYSALSSPPNGADGPGPATASVLTSHPIHITSANALGLQERGGFSEDDTELQELKIYLENQTDLLVQTIQTLVTSIRNDQSMTSVQAHISAIVDIVENVLSAAEGAMEDPSSYQAELRQKVTDIVRSLTDGKNKLQLAGNDPKAHASGPSSKTFTQRLPPLAFQIARETKELVSRIDSVEAKKGDDDFS